MEQDRIRIKSIVHNALKKMKGKIGLYVREGKEKKRNVTKHSILKTIDNSEVRRDFNVLFISMEKSEQLIKK